MRWLAGAIVVIGVPYVLGTMAPDIVDRSGGGAGTSSGPRVTGVARWWPDGFQQYAQDTDIVWRWDADPTCDIGGGACWGTFVIPRNGCPTSLYVELSVLDSSKNAIGYTNDVAGSVMPNQQAKLTFESFDEGAETARLAEITCY